MPVKSEFEKNRDKIYRNTVKKLKSLGTYRKEFDGVLKRYATMLYQYEILEEKFISSDCDITEQYTNKAGATNNRKTPLYSSLEQLRKELIDMENVFGLTPRGLKMIKAKGLESKKENKLAKALSKLET